MKKRVVFMGSPAFAVPSLRALAACPEVELVCVYTQPPRPAGRGQKLEKTAVHMLAEELGLEVRCPARLRGEALDEVLAIEADVFCVVAYGLLLPAALVDARVCVNVHPSPLPRWRGAAPLQWTLLAGDASTEVCVMRLDAGMDTGPVYTRVPLDVLAEMTLAELHDATADIGARELVKVVCAIDDLVPVAQVGEATHAAKITPAMRRIDWGKNAFAIDAQIRAIGGVSRILGEEVKLRSTEPLFLMHAGNYAAGEIISLDDKMCVICGGGGALLVGEIQRAGKRWMAVREVVNGWDALSVGARFDAY